MTAGLIVDHIGALIKVELCREPNNEFTREMCNTLATLLMKPPEGARVLLLRSAGDNFCTGRDGSAQGAAQIRSMAIALADVNVALVFSPLTVVVEVGGDAAGFGVGLAALGDVTVASSAANFRFPEVKAGLAPALVLTWLPYVVGRRQAYWLTVTGDSFDAREAHRLGLVNEVVSPEALGDRVAELVEKIIGTPASVSAQIKSDLRSGNWLRLREDSYESADRLAVRSLVLADEKIRNG